FTQFRCVVADQRECFGKWHVRYDRRTRRVKARKNFRAGFQIVPVGKFLLINRLDRLAQPDCLRLGKICIHHQPGESTAGGSRSLLRVLSFSDGYPRGFLRLSTGSPEFNRVQEWMGSKVPGLPLKAQIMRMVMGDSKRPGTDIRLL